MSDGLSCEQELDWLNEARCLMLLNDASVVRLVGVVTSSCPMYIVTELATHGSLKDCLRNNYFPDFHSLLNICTQVTRSYMHVISDPTYTGLVGNGYDAELTVKRS